MQEHVLETDVVVAVPEDLMKMLDTFQHLSNETNRGKRAHAAAFLKKTEQITTIVVLHCQSNMRGSVQSHERRRCRSNIWVRAGPAGFKKLLLDGWVFENLCLAAVEDIHLSIAEGLGHHFDDHWLVRERFKHTIDVSKVGLVDEDRFPVPLANQSPFFFEFKRGPLAAQGSGSSSDDHLFRWEAFVLRQVPDSLFDVVGCCCCWLLLL